MKICIILEPFPTRNSFGSMAWIGDQFAKMISDKPTQDQHEIRIASNHTCFNYICSKTPAARPKLIMYGDVSIRHFDRQLADWSTSALETWSNVQNGDEVWKAAYVELVDSVLCQYDADVFVYWGTNRAFNKAARLRGKSVVFCEYGAIRQPFGDFFCMDAVGVNGDAWLREISAEDLSLTVPITEIDLLRRFSVGEHTAHDVRFEWRVDFSIEFKELLHTLSEYKNTQIIALQLADDANVIRFSNGISMLEIAEDIINKSPSDTLTLIKPHPNAKESYFNLNYYEKIRTLCKEKINVIWLDQDFNHSEYLSLISLIDGCITLNSSVGFEAALFNKPIQVYGDASYVPTHLADQHGSWATPVTLDRRFVRAAIENYFIPSEVFWSTKGFVNRLEVELMRAGISFESASAAEIVQSPPVTFRDLGTGVLLDDQMKIERLGTLSIVENVVDGWLDRFEVYEEGDVRKIYLSGWAVQRTTCGPVAGIIIGTQNSHFYWLNSTAERIDVARVLDAPQARLCGFTARLKASDVPQLAEHSVKIYALLVNGCVSKLPGVFHAEII